MNYPVTRDIVALLPLAAIKDKRDNRGARCTGVDVARPHFGRMGPPGMAPEPRPAIRQCHSRHMWDTDFYYKLGLFLVGMTENGCLRPC